MFQFLSRVSPFSLISQFRKLLYSFSSTSYKRPFLPRKSQTLHLTVVLDDLFHFGTPKVNRIVSDFRRRPGKQTQNCGACYECLSTISNICESLKGKWKRKGEKMKPILHQSAKCSRCLINTNTPWQTKARPDSINFSWKRENMSPTSLCIIQDKKAVVGKTLDLASVWVYSPANLPWRKDANKTFSSVLLSPQSLFLLTCVYDFFEGFGTSVWNSPRCIETNN